MAYSRRRSGGRSYSQRRSFSSSRSRTSIRSGRSNGRRAAPRRNVTELRLVVQPAAPLNPALGNPTVESRGKTNPTF